MVSEYDSHEASNAIDQANREIDTRFDFRGSDASFVLENENIQLEADNEFQLQQMLDILNNKLIKRGIDSADHLFEIVDFLVQPFAAGFGAFYAKAKLEVFFVADEYVTAGSDLGECF